MDKLFHEADSDLRSSFCVTTSHDSKLLGHQIARARNTKQNFTDSLMPDWIYTLEILALK